MSPIVSTRVAKDICDALGLKNVRSLVLTFTVDAVATAEVTFFPDNADVGALPELMKRYELIEREPITIDFKDGSGVLQDGSKPERMR